MSIKEDTRIQNTVKGVMKGLYRIISKQIQKFTKLCYQENSSLINEIWVNYENYKEEEDDKDRIVVC